jgi:hypothetical protein
VGQFSMQIKGIVGQFWMQSNKLLPQASKPETTHSSYFSALIIASERPEGNSVFLFDAL